MVLFILAFAVAGVAALLVTHAANGNPHPCDEAHTQLQESSAYGGECVKAAQWYLNHPTDGTASYNLAEDGYFGPATKSAVQSFQFSHHVPNSSCTSSPSTCDGIVGPATWNAFHVSTAPPASTCPSGQTGTPPNCTTPPPPTCPAGQTGTPPNCTTPPQPTCPSGYTGTPPNCSPPPASTCPSGQTGTPPHCTPPPAQTCPSGQTGTPPNCTPASNPSGGSPAPTTAPSKSPVQGGSNPHITSVTPVVSGAVPDTTPPSVPTNFMVAPSSEGVSVVLSWQASTDNIGVQGYQLDRSTDQQNWVTISDGAVDTFFSDTGVNFNTHYFYRLRATDAAGNSSGYATADVSVQGFSANATPGKDIVLTSGQDGLKVTIPGGALSEPAACSLEALSLDSNSPKLAGYGLVGGPFQILCKKADNSTITSFNKPLMVQWTIVPPKNITGSPVYYTNANGWHKLTVTSHNSNSHTDSFTLGNGTTLVAMGKLKKSSPLVKILLIVVVVPGVILGTLYGFARWRSRKFVRAKYDDYYRKERGL